MNIGDQFEDSDSAATFADEDHGSEVLLPPTPWLSELVVRARTPASSGRTTTVKLRPPEPDPKPEPELEMEPE